MKETTSSKTKPIEHNGLIAFYQDTETQRVDGLPFEDKSTDSMEIVSWVITDGLNSVSIFTIMSTQNGSNLCVGVGFLHTGEEDERDRGIQVAAVLAQTDNPHEECIKESMDNLVPLFQEVRLGAITDDELEEFSSNVE